MNVNGSVKEKVQIARIFIQKMKIREKFVKWKSFKLTFIGTMWLGFHLVCSICYTKLEIHHHHHHHSELIHWPCCTCTILYTVHSGWLRQLFKIEPPRLPAPLHSSFLLLEVPTPLTLFICVNKDIRFHPDKIKVNHEPPVLVCFSHWAWQSIDDY